MVESKGDVSNGKGICKWPDGSQYEGEWKNGMKHGYGTYRWANGMKYIG